MSRSTKMYSKSPELKRDEKSGKMSVGVAETPKSDAPEQKDVTMTPVARHILERRDLSSKHEHEHHVHDVGGHGSKKEMHARHVKELVDMHKRHEKEVGAK
jgi:hypothetical protein